MTALRTIALSLTLWAVLPGQTHYGLDLRDAETGWLRVEVETKCRQSPCDFQMPVWNATYQIRDFAQFVIALDAENLEGRPIVASKVNPSRWRLQVTPGETVLVRYRVLADRPGPFGAYAGSRYVNLNLGQVLMYPVGGRHSMFTLEFINVPENWKTAIELSAKNGAFQAPSYDRLIDTPVLLAEFEQSEFFHRGRRIRIVAFGSSVTHDMASLRQTVEKIVHAATELMGDAPFPSYTFVYHFTDRGGGGMEYRNGTSIYLPAKCGNCNLAALTAHEFFHAWNVKRIRPKSLEPIDFTGPNITPSLWFCEGVTSTYARYLQLRAGLLTPAELLDQLGRMITSYESRSARRHQSAETSSIEAWLERYSAYNRSDRSISYYLKGELIGHLLDLTIRHHTRNRRSLDDVMRRLNQSYARKGKFFGDTDALERIATEVAGVDMTPVFRQLVRSPAPIPWDHYLGFAGLRLRGNSEKTSGLGLSLSAPPAIGVIVSAVEPGSVAERAGFRRNDRLFAVNGSKVMNAPQELLDQINKAGGSKVSITVEREGALISLEVKPRTTRSEVYRVVEVNSSSRLQRAIRRGWLERRTDFSEEQPTASFPSNAGIGIAPIGAL